MTYPNHSQILQIMSDIEKKKKEKSIPKLKSLGKNPSSIMKWKFKISQKISEFKTVRDLSLEEMASILNIDPANLSRIINGHIEKVTLDKLLSYLEIILIASNDKKISDKFQKSANHFFELDEIKFA
jgi:predicted XRE-type DNA-binding protein